MKLKHYLNNILIKIYFEMKKFKFFLNNFSLKNASKKAKPHFGWIHSLPTAPRDGSSSRGRPPRAVAGKWCKERPPSPLGPLLAPHCGPRSVPPKILKIFKIL
jgi:hypothetical protein